MVVQLRHPRYSFATLALPHLAHVGAGAVEVAMLLVVVVLCFVWEVGVVIPYMQILWSLCY